MVKIDNRLRIIIVVILLCSMLLLCCSDMAYAESGTLNFDKINVLDDLESAEDFNIADYPWDANETVKKTSVIKVVEYQYTPNTNTQGNYGVYIYFYNPKNIAFVENAKQNKVQIATSFDKDGTATKYEKLDITFCSKSETVNQFNKFYKFRISDSSLLLKFVNSEERKYVISGIELLTKGAQNAVEYTVGGTYAFSGYAVGCSPNQNTESSLKATYADLETIRLTDLNFSTFVSEKNNSNGANHYDQINSVYFSIDNKILEKYGKLQMIDFEFYEYKTSPIIVTKNSDVYSTLYNNRNAKASSAIDLVLMENRVQPHLMPINVDWGYNFLESYTSWGVAVAKTAWSSSNHLPYVFNRDFASKTQAVTSGELLSYIYDYKSSNFNGNIEHRNISKDLFQGTVDSGRTQGYNRKAINAGALYDLYQYDLDNGWNNFWYKLFGIKPSEEFKNIKPIVSVDDASSPKNLYINEKDEEAFKNAFNVAQKADKTLHAFRFAITDYYSTMITTCRNDATGERNKETYKAEQTAFLDLDLISFTFQGDNEKSTMLPVASSPIDVIGGLPAPDQNDLPKNWWDDLVKKFAIVLLILLLIVLLPIFIFFLPYLKLIIQVVLSIVLLPFKAVASLFKKKNKNKNNNNK